MTITTDSAARKAAPVTTGNFRYFPDAHLAIAQLSVYGNEKHNPGEPLHWSREKSNDHADCVGRHLLEPFGIDYSYGPEKPVLHAAQAAWRALANLQTEIEELKKQGKWPLPAAIPADCAPPQPMTAAEVARRRAEAGLDGWIKWNGGARPVAPGVIVETLHRDGARERSVAGTWMACWNNDNHEDDIVAYRVVEGVK